MRYREELRPVKFPYYLGQEWYRLFSPAGQPWKLHSAAKTYPASGQRPWYSATRCFDALHPGPPWVSGGPFERWKYADGGFKVVVPDEQPTGSSTVAEFKYVGGFMCKYIPVNTHFGVPSYLNVGTKTAYPDGLSTWGDVSSYGASAWKRYKPGRPSVDAGVFLAEARDIPRTLMTSANWFRREYLERLGKKPSRISKEVADNWLNTQFGWLPLVSDIRKLARTYERCHRTVEYIRRNNGKWVWRGGPVAESRDAVTLFEQDGTYHYPLLTAPYFYPAYPNTGHARLEKITSRKVWFAGRFRYWIPNIESPYWEMSARSRIWGLTPNPALLWELTPWSWLVDYFSNVGDILHNVDEGWAENLVAKYAYIMGTYEVDVDIHSVHNIRPQPMKTTWSYAISRKSRAGANPFGFDLTWDSLSLRQLSILSALGLSRLHYF